MDKVMEEMIRIEKATKSFHKNEIFQEISLSCKKGSIYGIVGYNGSGKTVLFKCICGFLQLDSGSIWIKEKKIGSGYMLKEAGIIIEEPSFLKTKSAYQNLKFLYMIRNKKDKKHLHQILEKVGLDPSSKKIVEKYSLGMKQRLAIAQAIMENPDILILDEPMNGLDKQGVSDMRELFLELKKQGKTILLASHNKMDIDVLCDEVYEMEQGKLVQIQDRNKEY